VFYLHFKVFNMPKESSKKRNRNNLAINSNFNLSNEINIIPNNNLIDIIKPSFPPTLTIDDLIKNALSSNKPKMVPNAFIAYRMALIREYRSKNKNIKLPRMGDFSRIAEDSWNKEPQHVKSYYNKLTKDAKSLYKQNTIQIVLDKHMNNVNVQKSGQVQEPSRDKRRVYCGANSDIEPIQDNVVGVAKPSHNNFYNNFQEQIRILQEYVKILEQTIDCLLQ
jgi:hypothetical protein